MRSLITRRLDPNPPRSCAFPALRERRTQVRERLMQVQKCRTKVRERLTQVRERLTEVQKCRTKARERLTQVQKSRTKARERRRRARRLPRFAGRCQPRDQSLRDRRDRVGGKDITARPHQTASEQAA